MIAYDERDVITLAKTLEGEARGEPDSGKVAVAWVVRNRASRRRFARRHLGGHGAVTEVCLAPLQFSCWNADDPNSAYLRDAPPEAYAAERAIAEDVLADRVPDPTRGADCYHTIAAPAGAGVWPPTWAAVMPEKARIGAHVFYNSHEVLMLSEHFSLPELVVTQQRGLDNTPSPATVENLRKTARLLESVRALFGKPIIVTSGYRSPEVNRAVGGSMHSQHLVGQATDFIIPGAGTPLEIARKIHEADEIRFDQLIHEWKAWVHISWSDAPRRMTLTIDANGTRGGLE